MKNILFVCTGNSCRSVMAEGLFRKAVAGREKEFVIGSAGVAAMDGYPSTLETIRAMHDEGVDMSGHKSRRLTREMVEKADAIYVMERLHREMIASFWPFSAPKLHLLSEFAPAEDRQKLGEDIPDPIQTSDDFYRQVLRMIAHSIDNIAKESK